MSLCLYVFMTVPNRHEGGNWLDCGCSILPGAERNRMARVPDLGTLLKPLWSNEYVTVVAAAQMTFSVISAGIMVRLPGCGAAQQFATWRHRTASRPIRPNGQCSSLSGDNYRPTLTCVRGGDPTSVCDVLS